MISSNHYGLPVVVNTYLHIILITLIYYLIILGLVVPIVTILVSCTYARISVMYAHEKLSDIAAEQCFNEMYPKGKHVEIQESDEPCIIFCVLKKIGIMNSAGNINLDIYR